jgi:hypothetical protein
MDISYYINRFFSIGSKATVRTRQRELLERLLSTEEQALTAEQQIQTLKNAGVKVGKLSLAKGTHEITFDKPFLAAYAASASGTSTLGATVNILIVDDSALDKFTIKVTSDCVVRWNAKIITQ